MLCLKHPTDASWAIQATRNVNAVLADHAHCELKAAANALSLAARHPQDLVLVRALTDLAREEIDHFQRVLSLLASRGVTLGPPPVDLYAAELRRAAAALRCKSPVTALVDRLLVAAIIEARSCERFKLLAEATREDGAAAGAHALWSELLAAEARHYRTFVDLAVRAAPGHRASVAQRLERLSHLEGFIVERIARRGVHEGTRATIHG